MFLPANLVPLEPQYSPKSAFPKVHRHTPNTAQTPAPSTLNPFGRLKRRVWDILTRLKEGDLRYSFKVGVSTAILAVPAFVDSTRPIFLEWRGEWALISVSETVPALDSGIVEAPPVLRCHGSNHWSSKLELHLVSSRLSSFQTNFLSIYRILGTMCASLGPLTCRHDLNLYPALVLRSLRLLSAFSTTTRQSWPSLDSSFRSPASTTSLVRPNMPQPVASFS